ncbi:PaaI family thioesterase [Solirubrobacter soli]|uniref:PaaI family thioesterase n=1 Tax=Solirubrobacter soli TaxID=363832 RepID=UPI001FDEA674|nr:PaaI family thioesterase [Solirubrobacter soli]
MADLIDIKLLERTENEVRAQVPVTDQLKQPLGLVHGGVYATIADILTAHTGRAVSNQTSFLRPITGGTIHATARRRHGGRTTEVWEVDITDDQGRPCALVRTTIYPEGP